MKLIDLNLITEEDFANYKGEVSLHKLIGYNNSDAKYIMLFLLGRVKEKHPEVSSLLEERLIITNDFGEEEETVKTEGARKTIMINTYERDRSLREKKIKANNGDCTCSICGFNFEKVYGDIGKGFIHVHHLQALSEIGSAHEVKLDKLILVCPNCHAMLHRRKPMYKPKDIKAMIKNRKE